MSRNIFWTIKDFFYTHLIMGDDRVQYEYERYVREHLDEHYLNRFKHHRLLLILNIHYRVKRKTAPLLYFDASKRNANVVINENGNYIPQSRLFNQNAPHWLAMEIMPYEIISFDVFDTAIFRPFDNPKTIFYIVGEKLGISGFYQIRINAEKEARATHKVLYGNSEVSIYEIYSIIEEKTGRDATEMVACEKECEIDLCFANPYIRELFDILKFQNKKIVFTTDMYLPMSCLQQILEKNGYIGYEKIYISNELQESKAKGNLFNFILRDFDITSDRMIHIGDSENGDVLQPKIHGIATKRYYNVNGVGQQNRPKGMSNIIGSAYRGIVNAKLYSGFEHYSFAYEYGYEVGGLYILGYMNYIYEKCKTYGIDTIWFLARDGDIYKKIYDRFFALSNVRTEYVLWSRIASSFCRVKKNKEQFINTFVNDKVKSKIPITVGELFASLGVDKLLKLLKEYNLFENSYVCDENRKNIARIISDNWDEIASVIDGKSRNIAAYIKRFIEKSERVAIVDVGWTGTNTKNLYYLIKDLTEGKVYVKIFLAAYTSKSNEYEELKGNIEPYIFSFQKNRDLLDIHFRQNKPTNNLFEILTQATMASFGGISGSDFRFDIPETENYETIQDIQHGISDFTDDYYNAFKNERYMLNISGRDAYIPFAHKLKDINWFKKVFNKFSVSMKTLGNQSEQRNETIADII